MQIKDYIFFGGEDLNVPAVKTAQFPDNASMLFDRWSFRFGNDNSEPERCMDLPVDSAHRLFLKTYWTEISGQRPNCYYVGFLLTREMYLDARNYSSIFRGLNGVSLEMVNTAIRHFSPIEIKTSFPGCHQPTLGKTLEDIKKMRLYGAVEYDANLNELCGSISMNMIDEWFETLFIAINPYRLYRDFNVVVSRKNPLPPPVSAQKSSLKTLSDPIASSKYLETTPAVEKSDETPPLRKSKHFFTLHKITIACCVLGIIASVSKCRKEKCAHLDEKDTLGQQEKSNHPPEDSKASITSQTDKNANNIAAESDDTKKNSWRQR